MPPGRVLDERSTAAQGDKDAQFRSAANGPVQGRTASRGDCNTNSPTSLKEARVTAKAVCVCGYPFKAVCSSAANSCFIMTSQPACSKHKTDRSEEALSKNHICGRTCTEGGCV